MISEDIKSGFLDVYMFDVEYINKKFDSDYLECIERFKEKYKDVLEIYSRECASTEDPERFAEEIADYIVSLEEEEEQKLKGKSARAMRNIDGALYTVMYILPVLSGWDCEYVKMLAGAVSTAWSERYGGEPLGIVNAERMASKFHGNWMKKILRLLKLSE